MLLVCPSCRTRYVVPDSAIGAAGRQVRCASCRHSWFQEGPSSVAPPRIAPVAQAAPAESARTQPASPPPTIAQPAPVPEAAAQPAAPIIAPGFAAFDESPPLPKQPVSEAEPAPFPSDSLPERSQFAHEPPFRPRRNPAKIMTYAAIAFAALVAITGGTLWYTGWLADSFTVSAEESKLKIVLHDNLELGKSADGSPFFIASGSIVNPTAQTQNVPNMLVTLKDASGRAIYNWEMKPPVRSLAAGAQADFSQLKRDVPLAASDISVVWILGS